MFGGGGVVVAGVALVVLGTSSNVGAFRLLSNLAVTVMALLGVAYLVANQVASLAAPAPPGPYPLLPARPAVTVAPSAPGEGPPVDLDAAPVARAPHRAR